VSRYGNSLSLKSSMAYFNSKIWGIRVLGYAGSYTGLGKSASSVKGACGNFVTSDFACRDGGRVSTFGPDVNPSHEFPQTFSIIVAISILNPIKIRGPSQSI
jgi:hypothetical protein